MYHTQEDLISVRPTLVVAGYLACCITAIFAIGLVASLPPRANNYVNYISEGMEQHCGWSVVVLGTTAFIIFQCQAVAALHMACHRAIGFSVLQMLGWNIVLGIMDTGWLIHYGGLFFFLSGSVCYHWIASQDINYGNLWYLRLFYITSLFTALFVVTSFVSSLKEQRELRAVAVGLEFVILVLTNFENMFVVWALDQYSSIHLIFDKR